MAPARLVATVSERRPRRSVSSESTSSGAMLPRLTSLPKRRRNQTCWSLRGASKSSRSTGDRVGDLVDQAHPHLAVGAEDAGVAGLARLGDHLPGAGRELRLDLLDPQVRRHDARGVLAADLREHDEARRRQALDQLELALVLQRDRPVGDLDVAQAELAQPGDQLVDAALRDRELGQRAAEHDGDPVVAVARELGWRLSVTSAVPQPSLTRSTALAGDLDEAVDLGDREAAVEHVRDAPLARLLAARREVEERRHGERAGYCAGRRRR